MTLIHIFNASQKTMSIFAAMIQEDKNVKGISIGETEHKISQYVDDTEIMLEGDRNSFVRTIKIIDIFGEKIRSSLDMRGRLVPNG